MAAPPRTHIDAFLRLHAPDRDLGQHFLTDTRVLQRALELAGDLNGTRVLEVGPGPGVLTERLLEAGATVLAVEQDDRAIDHLERTFDAWIQRGLLTLEHGDILRTTIEDVDAVVANIPYQISSPLLEWIEGHRARQGGFDTLVLLVQEEFALRMLGRHPMDRGPLSLNIALQWDLELDMKVGSGSFLPAPRVRSRLVHLRAHDRPTRVSTAFLRGLVRQAFAHRRRKLGTTLRTRPTGLEDAGLQSVDWSDVIRRWRSEHVELADRRPEDLDLNGWEQVALSIHAVAGIEPSHPTKPSQ